MSYNKKEFLLPDSHRSMACYHAKIEEDNTMKLTIHDCNKSIRLHNDLSNPEEVEEALEKLRVLARGAILLRDHIINNYRKNNNKQ
jgi:hypothetical protein